MNERIKELAEQAWDDTAVSPDFGHPVSFAEKFAELIIQAIYDKVKEELIEDEAINSEPSHFREYLKGCNGGIVDALCIIKNFGVEE